MLRGFRIHPDVASESLHVLVTDRNINRSKKCLRKDEQISQENRKNRDLQSCCSAENRLQRGIFQQPSSLDPLDAIAHLVDDAADLLRRTSHAPAEKSDQKNGNTKQDKQNDEGVFNAEIVHDVDAIEVLESVGIDGTW